MPVFAMRGSDLVRIAPDGTRVAIDDTVGTCLGAGNIGTGDACVVGGDCVTPGETCAPTPMALDPSRLCSDGQSLYVLAEDTFTDPRDNPDTELTGSLVRFDVDATGAVTGRQILYRTTDGTSELACDAFPGGAGGLAYVAEVRTVADTPNCSRDELQRLVSVDKSTGNARTVSGLSRIDQAAGVGVCDFVDEVTQLAVSADGVTKYAGFDAHGLWRIAPTPLAFSPDVHDRFQVHPDGSVVFAVAHDRGATGTIDLYRLTGDQVEHGALPLATLAPCASISVPNDTTAAAPASTAVTSIVLGPSALATGDATALVTFTSHALTLAVDVLPPFGDVRGTAAFSLPPGTTTCSALGLVSLRGDELAR